MARNDHARNRSAWRRARQNLGIVFAGAAVSVALSTLPVHAANDRETLQAALKAGDYAALDARIMDLQAAAEADPEKERDLLAALSAFEGGDPAMEPMLIDWVADNANKWPSHLASCRYYTAIMRLKRGEGAAVGIPPEQLADMVPISFFAQRDCFVVAHMHPALAPAHAAGLEAATLGSDSIGAERILSYGRESVPNSFVFNQTWLWSRQPQWGGRPGEYQTIMEQLRPRVAEHPHLKPLLGYAALEKVMRPSGATRLDAFLSSVDEALSFGEVAEFRCTRASLLATGNRAEEAEKDYGRCIALEPWKAGHYASRARLFLGLGRLEEVRADWDRALELEPFNPRYLGARAISRIKSGNTDGILDDLRRAMVHGSHDAEVRHLMGQAVLKLEGDVDAAVEHLAEAVRLRPDEAMFRATYEKVLAMQKTAEER